MNHRSLIIPVAILAGMTAALNASVLVPAHIDKITPATGMGFGADVSVDATTAAISMQGAPGLNTARSRAVFVYRKSGVNWNVVKELRRIDYEREFGRSISLSGDLLAIGAPYRTDLRDSDDDYYDISGRVYIYRRTMTGGVEDWIEETSIEMPATESEWRHFGGRVRLSGDTLAVGAPDAALRKVRMFRRTAPGAWVAGAIIVEPVEADGGLAIVGSYNPWAGGFQLQGNFLVAGRHTGPEPERLSQLLVFERSTGGSNAWGQFQRLSIPADGVFECELDNGFALAGNVIVAQMIQFDVAATSSSSGDSGTGFAVFERPAAAGAPFAIVHKRVTQPFPASTFAFFASVDEPYPIAAGPNTIAMARRVADRDGTREQVDVFTKTGATWDDLFVRSLLAGYFRINSERVSFPIALAGNVLFAAAHWSAAESPHARGVVEIFDGIGPSPLAPLKIVRRREPAAGSGQLGNALFASDSWLVAGDAYDDESLTDSGAVHIWRRLPNASLPAGEYWYPMTCVKAPVSFFEAHFGQAVVFDDSRSAALIAAPGEPDGGSVYALDVFTGVMTTLVSGPLNPGDRFGAALAQSGNFLAIGLPGADGAGSNSGSVQIFDRPSASAPWNYRRTLPPPAVINASDEFGAALSMDGDTLAVAAPFDEDSDTDIFDGSVFIYMRNQGGPNNWGLVTASPIKPSNSTRGFFGRSLALRGDELIVGAWPFALFGFGRGETFAFTRNLGGANRWGEVRTFYQAAFGASPDFGCSVALTGNGRLALVGSDNDSAAGTNRGSWHLFDRDTGGSRQWAAVSTEIPWVPTTEERFGRTVAAGDSVMAVAAPLDDTAGTDAGAIYTYRLGSYERWAADVGIVGARDMPPEGDWDRDGATNLQEFATGSDPRSSVGIHGGLSIRREGDGLLHLYLIKPPYPLDNVRYYPEQLLEISGTGASAPYLRWTQRFSSMELVTDTALSLHYRLDLPSSGTVRGALSRLRILYPSL